MASLISAGVATSIIDESFYVAGRQATVPLIFIATADEKLQADGVTPALGTFESGQIRVVTSIRQSLELYGVPKFHTGPDGAPFHGDARNEYGLDALNKFLEVGNRAYVVRANVNLNDSYPSIKSLWTAKIEDAADALQQAVDDYIAGYNNANTLFPTDTDYKETVTADELKLLVNEVLSPVFASYSFSSDLFALNFLRDHTINHAGYQDVLFDTSGGFLQATDATGLIPTADYTASIRIVNNLGTVNADLEFTGADVQTFGQLITEIQGALGADATVELVAGRLRITSSSTGVTSSADIISDGGVTGTNPLFASLNLFQTIAAPVAGTGPNPLVVYDDAFATILGEYDGLDSLIDSWNTGSVVTDEFLGTEAQQLLIEAAAEFDNTREFREETSLGANDASRKAEIVARLQAEINSATNGVRGDNLEYNIAICPGYPETADELLRLAADMQGEVFVIGETPFDKPATGPNGINTWARTPGRATSPDIAYAYPHGLSSNIDGATILTTAAATLLRTFAVNDSSAELWWAPAGTRRGRCEHLETIGYVSGVLGGPTTFVEEFLDTGTRDELYEFPKNINPITFIPGRGILVLGQKTASGDLSALDRVNVSRLVKYIRRELRKSLFSFLFEPNDNITRRNVKFVVDSFLSNLISRRGLYDFATICDDSNNTPTRIDANELWIDVAIKPVKSVEFIYVPIRIVNTGADLGTGRPISG